MIYIILLILIIGALILYYYADIQTYDRNNIQMINGGVGSGKSSTGLWKGTIQNYKKEMRKYKIKKFFFPKKRFYKPCIYSNIPLYNIEYKEFKLEHLRREISLQPKSVTYLNEMTLIADSMLAYNIGRDEARMRVNKELQLFMKLIRHETLGGCNGVSLVIDTQNPNDLPMAGDRVLSQTNYILDHRNLPFFRAVKVKTMLINMPQVENMLNDNEDSGHWYLVSKKVFKMYDSMCYHFLSADKIQEEPTHYIKAKTKKQLRKQFGKPFIIPTLTQYHEIIESNKKIIEEQEKKKGDKENGEKKQIHKETN